MISKLYYTLVATLLIHTSVYSDDNNFRVDGLAEPSTYIHGCVSAITGTFVYSFTDMYVDGPEPLTFVRHYSSSNETPSMFGYGFSHNYPYTMEHGKIGKRFYVWLEESFGSKLRFYNNGSTDSSRCYVIDKEQLKNGMTNSSGSILSGRSNPKNTVIDLVKEKGKKWEKGDVTVIYGDGSKKNYPKSSILDYELLPSGNYIKYSYDKYNRLKKIYVTDASKEIIFNSLNFEYNGDDDVKITGSNGAQATYTLKKHKKNKQRTLRSCMATGVPETEVSYHDWMEKVKVESEEKKNYNDEEEDPYAYKPNEYKKIYHSVIKRIRMKNQGYLHLEYDHDGKVKKIYSEPSYGNGEVLYSISYHNRHKYTSVTDPLNCTSKYHYNARHQLDSLEQFDGKELYRGFVYDWGDDKSNDAGNLICKAICDKKYKRVLSNKFQYDENGNVIYEFLLGNLTGNGSTEDIYQRWYTYTNNGMNLPLTLKEQDGTEVRYRYLPGTNKVVAKFDLAKDRIYRREFFEYDALKIATQHIVDDGSGTECNDLTDVTRRIISRHEINREPGSNGFYKSKSIVKSYWEPREGKEIRLTRIDYQYGNLDLVIREDHYDADDNHEFSHHYEYDDHGNCIREIDKDGRETLYSYDGAHQCIYKKTTGSGFEINYIYDSRQRLINTVEKHDTGEEFTQSTTYNLMDLPVSQIDRYGNETRLNYDTFGRLVQKILPKQLTDTGNFLPREFKYKYDIQDRVISEIDPGNIEVRKNYNGRGHITDVYFSDGTSEHTRYRCNGKAVKKYLKNGNSLNIKYDSQMRPVKELTYSSSGEVLRSMKFEYSGANVVKEIDYIGQCKEYEYDGAGRKIGQWSHGDGISYREEYYYDPSGRHHMTKSWTDDRMNDYILEIKEFDINDRVIEERTEDSQGNICSKKQFAYDFNGNCIHEAIFSSEGIASVENREFSSYNKIIKKVDTLGNITRYRYDFRYINEQQQKVLCITETDPKGIQTVTIHDAYERPVKIKKMNLMNRLIGLETICYDLRGNKIQHRTHVIVDEKEERQYDVNWQYDSMNRVISMTEDRKGKNKLTTYTYDKVGNILTQTKPDGVELKYEYDELDRERQLTSSDGSIAYLYRYNLSDQLVESKDCLTGATLYRDYDGFGRLSAEVLPNGARMTYQYDGLNRITHVGLHDGSRIEYRYEKNELKTISKYTPEDLLAYTHEYIETDWQGKSIKSKLINGDECTFSWDIHGRYRGVETKQLILEIPDDGYDPNGNLLKINCEGVLGSLKENYRYDDSDQLISEDGLLKRQYRNDSLNNRISKDQIPQKLNTLNQVEYDGTTEYTYDYNGNLIIEKNKEGEIRYQYDALNRLCTVEKLRKWMVKSAYDSYGRCTSTKTYKWQDDLVEEEERHYLYQGLHEIGAMDAKKQVKQLRIMGKREGLAFRSAIAIEIEGITYTPLYNQRYDVIALLNTLTGTPVETYRYSAFGEFAVYDANGEKASGTKVGNPWLYGNKRYDDVTDLSNFGKRYYRARLGRWITPDPGDFVDGYNLYAYTRNRPLTCTDFFGFSTCDTVQQDKKNPSYMSMVLHAHTQSHVVVSEAIVKAFNTTIKNCYKAVRFVGECYETVSHHAIPSSAIQYFYEGVGLVMQGKSFTHQFSGQIECVSGSVGEKKFNNCLVRYISGYLNSKEITENTAKMISEMLGGHQVHYTSHQSRGLSSDTLAVIAGALGFEHYSIQHLKSIVKSDYDTMNEKCGQDFKLFYYTHSRGAFDFYLATRDLPDEFRRKMHVITLAGAVKLSNAEFGSAVNYENQNDFIKPVSRLLTRYMATFKNCEIIQTNFTNGGLSSPFSDHFIDSEGYMKIMENFSYDILNFEVRK